MCIESDDCFSLYSSYEKRLHSFKGWKGKVSPDLLARSGFYYTLEADICKCICCGLLIFDWCHDDCPIDEHSKFMKNCYLAESLWMFKKNRNKIVENKRNFSNEVKNNSNDTVVLFLVIMNMMFLLDYFFKKYVFSS